jgi:hypothetical protein
MALGRRAWMVSMPPVSRSDLMIDNKRCSEYSINDLSFHGQKVTRFFV